MFCKSSGIKVDENLKPKNLNSCLKEGVDWSLKSYYKSRLLKQMKNMTILTDYKNLLALFCPLKDYVNVTLHYKAKPINP